MPIEISTMVLTDFHDPMMRRSFHYPFQIYIQKKEICYHWQLVNLDTVGHISMSSVIWPKKKKEYKLYGMHEMKHHPNILSPNIDNAIFKHA